MQIVFRYGDVEIMEEMEYFVLFPNVNEGLMLEKRLRENNIRYTIVPTPRELSKCCGIAIKYSPEDEDAIRKIIEKNNIKVVGFQGLKRRKLNVKPV